MVQSMCLIPMARQVMTMLLDTGTVLNDALAPLPLRNKGYVPLNPHL